MYILLIKKKKKLLDINMIWKPFLPKLSLKPKETKHELFYDCDHHCISQKICTFNAQSQLEKNRAQK